MVGFSSTVRGTATFVSDEVSSPIIDASARTARVKGSLRFVAASLDLPLSKVYGVATFYHLFMLKPKGRHTCVVCAGTACYIKGAAGLVKAVEQRFGAAPGATTPDDRLSLLTARCVGACGLAPAVVLDGNVLGKQAADELLSRIEELT